MITYRKYTTDDWMKINDAVEPFATLVSTKSFVDITKCGVSITAIEDDSIKACGGISYMNDKQGVAWLRISKECKDHPIKWAREIKAVFGLMVKAVGIEVSTYILSDFCKGEKIAKLIGMIKTEETEEYDGNIYNKYMVVT